MFDPHGVTRPADAARSPPRGRRILYVENVGWGFLTHRIALAVAALDAGYDVHVAANVDTSAEVEAIERHGIQFHKLSLARGLQRIGSDLWALGEFSALYRRLKPDLIHHVTIKPVIYGSLIARSMPSTAVVNTVSGLGHLFVTENARAKTLRAIARIGYRIAFSRRRTHTIFQNEDDQSRFATVANSSIVAGAGVDLERYQATPEPSNGVVVLLPARMLREKGLFEFAEAARILRSEGVHARFQLAGSIDSANPGALTELELRALERDANVEWLGFRPDVPALMQASSIVCLPSYYGEGLPKALIEAAASARSIVTTDVPGCRHVVEHGRNGLIVPPRDSKALANALRLLIKDASLRERLGRNGRDIAVRKFDVNILNAQTLRIYDELLADHFRATTAAT